MRSLLPRVLLALGVGLALSGHAPAPSLVNLLGLGGASPAVVAAALGEVEQAPTPATPSMPSTEGVYRLASGIATVRFCRDRAQGVDLALTALPTPEGLLALAGLPLDDPRMAALRLVEVGPGHRVWMAPQEGEDAGAVRRLLAARTAGGWTSLSLDFDTSC